METKYNIYYNDGVYYGTMNFNNVSQGKIDTAIQAEINKNNTNVNTMYHISRDNFKEE